MKSGLLAIFDELNLVVFDGPNLVVLAGPQHKKQEVQLTVISGDKAGDTYRTLVCRVRRWEDKRFHVAMDRLKEYSVISDHRDYADQCVEQLKAA